MLGCICCTTGKAFHCFGLCSFGVCRMGRMKRTPCRLIAWDGVLVVFGNGRAVCPCPFPLEKLMQSTTYTFKKTKRRKLIAATERLITTQRQRRRGMHRQMHRHRCRYRHNRCREIGSNLIIELHLLHQ